MADPTSTPSDRRTLSEQHRTADSPAAGASAARGGTPARGDGGGGGENPDGGGGIAETVTIGHLAPLNDPLGVGSKRSAEMAVAEINDDGGIADQTVELVTKDTRASPSEARTVAGELVRQEEVDAIVGTFSSVVTRRRRTSCRSSTRRFWSPAPPRRVPHGVRRVRLRALQNTFRVGPVNSHFQAEVISQYASHLSDRHGWNTFAVVADDAEWTTVFRNRLVDLLKEADLDVPMVNGLATDTTSSGRCLTMWTRRARTRCSAASHSSTAGRWRPAGAGRVRSARGVHVASMLPAYTSRRRRGGLRDDDTVRRGGCHRHHVEDGPVHGGVQEAYGDADDPPSKPMYMGFVTYDAIHVFKNAAERAGTVDQENNLDTIVDALLRDSPVRPGRRSSRSSNSSWSRTEKSGTRSGSSRTSPRCWKCARVGPGSVSRRPRQSNTPRRRGWGDDAGRHCQRHRRRRAHQRRLRPDCYRLHHGVWRRRRVEPRPRCADNGRRVHLPSLVSAASSGRDAASNARSRSLSSSSASSPRPHVE